MLKRLFSVAVVSVALAACAGGPPPEPPAPPPLDPTGTWEVAVDAQGMMIVGYMTISGSAEAGYRGDIDTDMGGAALSNIAVDGQTLTFEIPDAGVSVTLEVDGDEFSGTMSGAMGDGTITGMRAGQ